MIRITTMSTTTVLIDKFAFVQGLEKRGFTRAQAEGIADTVTDIAIAQLVSKVDMRDAIAELKVDLLKYMFGAMAAQTALFVALIELLT
jgi:hypothetical protein